MDKIEVLINVGLVMLGGALGSTARYLFSLIPYKPESLGGFPLLTFIINLVGSFFIGVVAQACSARVLSNNWTTFLRVGIIGGFTTFSGFSIEDVTLWQQGKYVAAVLYVVFSVLFCIGGCFLGVFSVKWALGK